MGYFTMERCNRQKNRDLTMVAVWVLVHPGYPVTDTETYYYYSRTYYLPTYLPTFWVRCDEFQATSSLDRLLPLL
jgi:hypothetical protein